MLEVGTQVRINLRDFIAGEESGVSPEDLKMVKALVGCIKEIKLSTIPSLFKLIEPGYNEYLVFFPKAKKETWLSEGVLIEIPPLEQLAREADEES